MYEPDCVANEIIDIPHIHRVAGFVEAKSPPYWYPWTVSEIPLIVTEDVLEVVGNHINEFELNRFVRPYLPKVACILAFRLGHPIYRVVDRYACKKSETR